MNTSDSPGIRSRREDGVGIVTISNAKKRNAFTVQMLKDIRIIFDAFDQAEDVKSIVLEGEGDQAFASGDDISEFAEHRSTAADLRARADDLDPDVSVDEKPVDQDASADALRSTNNPRS